jgi:hypothetical protein
VRPVGKVSSDPIAHRLCFVDAPVAEASVLNMRRFLFCEYALPSTKVKSFGVVVVVCVWACGGLEQ